MGSSGVPSVQQYTVVSCVQVRSKDGCPRAFDFVQTPRHGQSGIFWELFQDAERRADAYAVNKATWDMNPSITQASLEAERQRDAVMYSQEYEANFLAGGDEFLSRRRKDRVNLRPRRQL